MQKLSKIKEKCRKPGKNWRKLFKKIVKNIEE